MAKKKLCKKCKKREAFANSELCLDCRDKDFLDKFHSEMEKPPNKRGEIWREYIQSTIDDVNQKYKDGGRPKKWDNEQKEILDNCHVTEVYTHTKEMFDMPNTDIEKVKKMADRKKREAKREDFVSDKAYNNYLDVQSTIYKQACRVQGYNIAHRGEAKKNPSNPAINPWTLDKIEKAINDLKRITNKSKQDYEMLQELRRLSVKLHNAMKQKRYK